MSVRTVAVLSAAVALLVVSLAADAGGATGTEFHRRVARALASPGPVGALDWFSDEVTWRVVVPAGGRVDVRADAESDATPFYLRFEPWDRPSPQSPVPAAHQDALLQPGDWRVRLDPAFGAQVDVRVVFGGPVAFQLHDVSAGNGCAPPGACLP